MRDRLGMIDSSFLDLSISRQCELLNVARSTYYYKPIQESEYNLLLMQKVDQQYLKTPFYGSRLMTASLNRNGYPVNQKRISRLMRVMGIKALYPKPKKGLWTKKYGTFPYLLKDVEIKPQNHVWATDITYIPVKDGYLYLVAVLDLFSRFVLSWKLSNSLESNFCVEAVKEAFKFGRPQIFNTDQGSQFTSHRFIETLQKEGIQISMSGKGRCWDNIFVERFWRSLKYEEVYLKNYCNYQDAYTNIGSYIEFYNSERLHSSLNYYTPLEIYRTT